MTEPSPAAVSAVILPARGRARRGFLKQAGGALMVGVFLPELARARTGANNESGAASVIQGDGASGVFAPNAFVRIDEDDTVTVLIKHIEFGQGPYTGLATLVAEELDADWAQMRAEAAPANVELYKNLAFGIQGTGGSTAMANSYEQMRRAGAAARAMLVRAAADEWQVGSDAIVIENGILSHPDGHRSGFGALAAHASRVELPVDPPLKDAKDFRLIGTRLPRLDTADKTDGRAQFTLDVYRENMLTAVVLHPPVFGATLASVDDTDARAVKGVQAVAGIPQGVAVYADSTYAALKGRNALKAEWDTANAETRSTAELKQRFRQAVGAPGKVVEVRGDIEGALASGDKALDADYHFPFLAHAPMEPLDAVIEADDSGVDVWLGSQMQTVDHQTVAGILGRPPDMVRVHTMLAGGSFGRRAQPASSFAAEAAEIFKASGTNAPVKLLYTREDDIRGGFYRPLTVHRLRGRVDADGSITGWDNIIASQSIISGTPLQAMAEDGIDPTSVEGARHLPYAIQNLRVSLHTMEAGVPVLWWRSVGHTHTAFATETFLDELLEMGDRDPLEGRMQLLQADSRDAAVLKRVGEMADWGRMPAEGRARGVALHKSFGTYVAQIAEVSENGNGIPRVHKVWCAVDCGLAINPDVIVAQIEGGIGYGLGAALFNEITLGPEGQVAQSNFHDYRSLRIDDMPAVEVAILRSGEPPTGIGEPGVPPIAPAVANGWRALTGNAVRELPFLPVGSS